MNQLHIMYQIYHNTISIRSSQAKKIGHCVDTDVHVVTVVGKLQEVTNAALSDTTPAVKLEDMTRQFLFIPPFHPFINN